MDNLILPVFLALPALGFLALTLGLTRMAAVRDLPWLGRALWLLPAAVYALRVVEGLTGPEARALAGEPWLFDLTLALRDCIATAGAVWLVLMAAGLAGRLTARA